MSQVQVIRIVVASPKDVQSERDMLPAIIEELNKGIAAEHTLRLELTRWETDAYPGFHPEGPQGLIDERLRIEDCDVFIGIFWKRFGTPTKDAKSGTEHEIQRAYRSWKEKGQPQIMVYFNQKAYAPKSKEETDQWGQVLEFQSNFPEEGLWWTYKSRGNFETLVRNHLTQFIRGYLTSSHNLNERLSGRRIQTASRDTESNLEAIYLISSAISDSLELPKILNSIAVQVSEVLQAPHVGIQVEGEREGPPLTVCYFRDGERSEPDSIELAKELDAHAARFKNNPKLHAQKGGGSLGDQAADHCQSAVVPLTYHDKYIGVLLVRSDDEIRVWQRDEIFIMQTVASQVAVAINQARIFGQIQHEALTDSMTGCFNRRFFEIQLERDLHLATRMRQPVSLLMIDLDHFKAVNNSFGYKAGDNLLSRVAGLIREQARGVDTAARFGSADFAVILPQANPNGAAFVAERIRQAIEEQTFPVVNHITTSIGIATFPLHATSRDSLIEEAHRALNIAKLSGRNRVCLSSEDSA